MTGDPKRLPSLDGFRAVSIMMVLVAHVSATEHFPHQLARQPWLTRWGATGVHVFFVISGFLITWLLLVEERRNHRVSLRAFYLRRALRILPVYICYLLAVFVFDRIRGIGVPTAEYIKAWTFTSGLFPEHHWLLGHTWSLAVEEHFYVLWPIVFALASMSQRLIVAAVVVVGWPVLRIALVETGRPWLVEFSFLGQGDVIMWGCLIALVTWCWSDLVDRIVGYHHHLGRGVATAIVGFVAIARWKLGASLAIVALAATAEALAVAYLLCSFTRVHDGIVYRFFNTRVMIWIGVLSYSLYLWQQLILFPRSPVQLSWQTFPRNLACLLVVATISYFAIERPFLRLRHSWSKRAT